MSLEMTSKRILFPAATKNLDFSSSEYEPRSTYGQL